MELLNEIIIKLTFRFNQLFRNRLSTGLNRFWARLKGVKIGKGYKTYGYVHFHRTPGSIIEIGEYCEFRSRANSNLIGINHNCIISTHNASAEVKIGKHSGFSGVTIGCAEKIAIGAHCMIGANVIITDTDWHSLNPMDRKTGKAKSRPTIIHDRVFIGVNSIVLKGSEIGENSVIGAGSVVSGFIPANVIAAGNPCKVVKNLEKHEDTVHI